MLKTTLILAAIIAAVGFVLGDRPLLVQQLRVVSSDANARFLELGFNKSVAIDLPRDVREVLVADPKTVTVVVRTMRRVYITGAVMGNTNVFFYDDGGRQIAALDVCVSEYHHPHYDKSGIDSKGMSIAGI